jgi:nicotinamidase-related amidase
MDRVLRANGVESVVLAGVTTQGCVLSSALDSQWYDYYTVIAKDAVASTKPELHQLGMEQLSTSYHLPTVEELAAIWAEAPVFVR